MSTPKHTPTPYAVAPNPGGWVKRPDLATILIEEQATHENLVVALVVTDCPRLVDQGPANAEFIVRACNSHDDLLAACESFVALFRDSDMRPEDECHELYEAMTAAISKAKGGAA